MRLVDTAAEQELLEQLLEASKPPLPEAAAGVVYLLSTPFRYVSQRPSRFRAAGEPGVWYGAEHLETACAEVGYWRWRFLMDSVGLRDQSLYVEFTIFEARVHGTAIDLTARPWSKAQALWTDPVDYAACHALADAARIRAVKWLRYASVRDPSHHRCGAVFDARSLSLPRATIQQTWAARIERKRVTFSHGSTTLEFETSIWVHQGV